MHVFEEAQESENYVCRLQPLDADSPMHGLIIIRNGLECHQPMEFDYNHIGQGSGDLVPC